MFLHCRCEDLSKSRLRCVYCSVSSAQAWGKIVGAEQGGAADLYRGAQGLHGGNTTWARSKRNRMLAEIGEGPLTAPEGLVLDSGNEQSRVIAEFSPNNQEPSNWVMLSKPQCEVCAPVCVDLAHT